MTNTNLKPTVIQEIPFPVGGQKSSDSSGGANSPNQIGDKSFPTPIVANNVVSASLNTMSRRILSNFSFTRYGAISVGNYDTGAGVRISPNGIVGGVAGVPNFTLDATTGSLSLRGAIVALSGSIGGFTIQSDYLYAGSGANTAGIAPADYPFWAGASYANRATAPFRVTPAGVLTLSGASSSISIGSGNSIFIASSNGIQLGHATFASAPFSVTPDGALKATNAYISGDIVLSNDGDQGTGTKLRWEGGARIWSDASSNIGINAVGNELDLYVNSNLVAYFGSGNTNIYQHLHVPNIDMALGGNEGSISNVDRISGYNDLHIVGNGDVKFPRDNSDGAGVRIEWGTGKIFSYSSTMNLAGTDKTAIVPTSRGYKSLYCAESPEVWFFDFCKVKTDIDPLFLEVTEGEMKFIRTDDGFQVWRKRKGHANKRFEAKTALQFYKNEAFLRLAK